MLNLTPVNAAGLGSGQLVSSDVIEPPVASNVNFSPGSFDPNVAFGVIGGDDRVCFVNSEHTSVDLVADQLGTIRAGVFHSATPTAGRSGSSTHGSSYLPVYAGGHDALLPVPPLELHTRAARIDTRASADPGRGEGRVVLTPPP